jgi:hypothetical protein
MEENIVKRTAQNTHAYKEGKCISMFKETCNYVVLNLNLNQSQRIKNRKLCVIGTEINNDHDPQITVLVYLTVLSQ